MRVETFDGLMVDYAKSMDATGVLRGIRAGQRLRVRIADGLMNRKLEPSLETVFMMPAGQVFLPQFAAGARSGAGWAAR